MGKSKFAIVLGHAVSVPVKGSGGIEKVFWNIVSHWPDTSCVDLFARKGPGQASKEKIKENVNIYRLEGYDWKKSKVLNVYNAFKWSVQLSSLLKEYDAVLYNTVCGPFVHSLSCNKASVALCDQRGTGQLHFLTRPFIDRLFAISKQVKNQWKWSNNNTVVISNCVDCSHYTFTDTININKIIFVGRIAKEKGLDTLIKSMHRIHDKGFKVNLDVVGPWVIEKGGEPDYYQYCSDLTSKLCLSDYVHFREALTGEKLIQCIQNSDMLCCPSIWPEAFGIVIIEALSCGIPVAGSNIGAIPEIIQNGECGYLFEPKNDNELAEIIVNYYKLSNFQKMAIKKKARDTALRYNVPVIAKIYEKEMISLSKS